MKLGKRTSVAKELTRQERNKKNNIKRLSISAAAAFVLFICLLVIQSSILNQEKTFKVYQVSKDLPVSTKLTEGNIESYLTLKEVQESLIPSGYITEKDKLLDKFVNRDYKTNDIITEDGITDTEKMYKDSIKNPVEISFDISSLGAVVSGILREGDYINIYGLRRPEVEGEESRIYVVDDSYTFKHVYITKAFNSDGARVETLNGEETTDGSKAATMFNVIISEEDTDLFNEMLKNCDIKVSKLLYETEDDYTKFISDANKNAAKASKSKKSKDKSDDSEVEESIADRKVTVTTDNEKTDSTDSETPSSETPSSETPSSETPSSETPSSETPSNSDNTANTGSTNEGAQQ